MWGQSPLVLLRPILTANRSGRQAIRPRSSQNSSLIVRWQTSGVTVYSVCNAFTAATVNSYLVSRYYRVSKNLFVTLFLCALVLLQLSVDRLHIDAYNGAFGGSAVSRHKTGAIPEGGKNWAYMGRQLVHNCPQRGTSRYIHRSSTGVYTAQNEELFNDTNRLLRRLMFICIQNGCATSLMALGGMTAVIIKVDSNISSVFYFSVPPLYVLTLLSNFNLRESGKSGSRTWSSRNNNTHIGPHSDIVIEGIRVRRDGGLNDPTESEIEIISPRLPQGEHMAPPQIQFSYVPGYCCSGSKRWILI
ncbi:hypothetical protein DFH06DRAFT_1147468 [Mycena polygramma]|nr:hypothetical protein DFH06DRAFT_1147468 [Mycena polygramma]